MYFDISKFLIISISLLFISFIGIIFNRSNVITTYISIEMMLLSINLNFIIYSCFLDDILGQVYSLFLLTVGAGEAAIGLGILITFFRVRKDTFIYSNLMKF
jgi:NADH-quinone oxidoreductase subunit K